MEVPTQLRRRTEVIGAIDNQVTAEFDQLQRCSRVERAHHHHREMPRSKAALGEDLGWEWYMGATRDDLVAGGQGTRQPAGSEFWVTIGQRTRGRVRALGRPVVARCIGRTRSSNSGRPRGGDRTVRP